MILLQRGVAFGLVGVGAVAALATGAQAWWTVAAPDATETVSGNLASGSLTQALGIVGLAGLLLSLVLGVRGSRVLGVVLAATGIGACAVGLMRPEPAEAAVRDLLQALTLETNWAMQPTGWNWAYAAAGLVLALGGVLVVVGAPRWTSRSHRFDRQGQHVDLDDPHAIWKALDAGVDPTEGSAVPSSPETQPTTKRKNER